MSRPHTIRSFAFAFLGGCLMTYLCTRLKSKLDRNLLSRKDLGLPEQQPADVSLPASLGLSPMALSVQTGSATVAPERLIVAVRHGEDTSWLDVYLSDIPHVVYHNADPKETQSAQHKTLMNKGNEAMGYLQFIVDYYDRLPASIAFIHGHRFTWHLRDHVPLLRRLNWGAVPFANLRFRNGPHNRLRWECGDQTNVTAFKVYDCDWVGSFLYPTAMKPRQAAHIHTMNKDEYVDGLRLAQVWDQVYLQEMGPIPPVIHSPCCAEFIVGRERILAHPRAFYVHLRDWIIATELDWTDSGRVFEHMWPQIFGEPAVLNPVEECALLRCNETERALAAAPTAPTKLHFITIANSASDAQWTPGAELRLDST